MKALILVAMFGVGAPAAGQLVSQVPRGNIFNPEIDRARRHYEAGWQLYRHEDWTGAVKEFEQAVAAMPTFADGYYAVGRAELAQRHFVSAIAAFTKCRNLYMTNAGDDLVKRTMGTQKLDELILEQKMVLQQLQNGGSNKSQTSQLSARTIENKISQLELARDRNQTISLDMSVPFYVPLSLGAAYFRSGKYADAEREFKTAIEANSKSGEAHSNLAVLYMTTGRIQEAATEISLAEKTGFKVNSGLKEDLEARRKAPARPR
jgi:tetratricopeptide (TPR) repeat protein